MSTPLVSIVTATYNAGPVLRYAIASVLASHCQDWELLVIGDCCSEDTEAVVASFDDARIRFHNLPQNSGQQATPNNVGVGMARGKYLCFLNQDDMFLPWHLDYMLEQALLHEDSILLARYAEIWPDDEAGRADAFQALNGGPRPGHPGFDPARWHIASSWFMPLALAQRLGPWKVEADTVVTPSQDWLFRAWRGGAQLALMQRLSLLQVVSGQRKNFYRDCPDAQHAYLFQRYVSEQQNYDELMAMVERNQAEVDNSRGKRLRRLYEASIGRLSRLLGVHPNTLEMALRFGGRGGLIRQVNKRQGKST